MKSQSWRVAPESFGTWLKSVGFLLGILGVFTSCAGPGYESTNPLANSLLLKSAVDDANKALSSSDCETAYLSIYPLYNSTNTNNEIRTAMAATYGCYSGVNVLNLLSDLINFQGNLGGSGLWEFLAQAFPSVASPDDKKPQAAMNGIDAVMSIIDPATIIVPAYKINSDTNNPGSLLYADRTNDANSYLTFLSMALLGTLENRYGVPTSNYHKSVDLPWTIATATEGDGCAFASALLNLSDGLQFLSLTAPSNVAAIYSSITTFLGPALDAGCSLGCTLCGGGISCSTCPTNLRDRSSCTGLTTDMNSCAAAGLVTFVNSSWQGPP